LNAQTGLASPLPRDAARGGFRHRGVLCWPALTLDHIWLTATLVFAFLAGTLIPVQGPDYWWTVKLGEGLWLARQLPTADWLSFTATGAPSVEQQWLAQVVLAAVHHLGGVELALLLRALIQVLVTGGLFLACRRLGASAPAAAIACGLALPLIVSGAAVRPQLITLPLFTLFLLGTTIWQGRTWTLAVLPLALIAWANLHGTFLLGIVLVGVALLGRGWQVRDDGWRADVTLRRLALLLALCLVVPFVHPYGFGLVPWLIDYMRFNTGGQGLPILSTEWQPTSLAELHGKVFFLTVLVLAIVLVRVGPPPPADSLRLVAFVALGLQSVRGTAWCALVIAPVLAWGLSRWWSLATQSSGRVPQGRLGIPALNTLLIVGLCAVASLSLPWARPADLLYKSDRFSVLDPVIPVGAADYTATLPATRLFNHADWGGYLEWRLAPRQQVFVDTRFQDHPAQTFRDYFTIIQGGPGWADLLSQYEVDGLVLNRNAEAPLVAAIDAAGTWQAVYCDAESAVYLRRTTASDRAVSCVARSDSSASLRQ
jgi:hypothetical protein